MAMTFEDARVGDRAWCYFNGWGVISGVARTNVDFPITMDFGNKEETYTFDGYMFFDVMNPCLFWDEIKFTAPPMPERVRYKNVSGFKVPDIAIDDNIPYGTAYIVPNPTSLRCFSERWANNHVETDMHIRHGLAYHDTNAGHAAATAHARAWLGEGDPWTD